MPRDSFVTTGAANIARIPFRIKRRQPFENPKKLLILKPCCISQVMMATPLLAALNEMYPDATIDWVVDSWSRPAVSGNPRLSRIIDCGRAFHESGSWGDINELIETIRKGGYDTCFVPSRSAFACYAVWRAGIPQRVGLDSAGRGFAYTVPVSVPKGSLNQANIDLLLANAIGIEYDAGEEFFPSDQARGFITKLIVEEVAWSGDSPLVIIHPGGGTNPIESDVKKQWPAERFTRLANRLSQDLGARVVLVASEDEKKLAADIIGLMSAEAVDLAGRLDLDQIGALAEVADLYVGNDAGGTHVAAAVGCKTLVVYGPTDSMLTAPYATKGKVTVAAPKEGSEPFSWDKGPTVEGVTAAAVKILESERSDLPG